MLARKTTTLLALLLLLSCVDSAAQSADDRYPFVKDGKVGFIDSQGNEVIPARFSSAGDMAHFSDGLAPVWGPEGGGYIDPAGKFVIGPQTEWGAARPFHEGVAGVLLWGKGSARNRPAWIDRSGKVVFVGEGAEGAYFSEGLMPQVKGGKWGFVDKSFNFVIRPQFDWAESFREGRAVVKIGRKWGFVDKSGKVVIPPKYDLVWQFSDGLARVRYDVPNGKAMTIEGEQNTYLYKYGYVDHSGREVIAPQYGWATYFSGGLALAAPPGSELLGIIDKGGSFVRPPEYEAGVEFHEGLAAVKVNGGWGYVDTGGSWVVPPILSHAEEFRRGLARVAWEDGAYGYINKRGETVWRHAPLKKEGRYESDSPENVRGRVQLCAGLGRVPCPRLRAGSQPARRGRRRGHQAGGSTA